MADSNGNILDNTGHAYRECSNRGTCDRATGLCLCLDGYGGSACQRTSCPISNQKVCSGHGVCLSARELAANDGGNIYRLWDQDITMGCSCEPGFHGPDCSIWGCKIERDPVYFHEESSIRFSNWSVVIRVQSPTAKIFGNYSFTFYDYTGKDWEIRPVQFNASCLDIVQQLESIPNSVIPPNTVRCMKESFQSLTPDNDPVLPSPNPYYGIKYTLAFPSNPGKLKQPIIKTYLDGTRTTLQSTDASAPVQTFIYPNGFSGETTEYFLNRCEGVDVSLHHGDSLGLPYDRLEDLTSYEMRLLSRCLGDADGLPSFSDKGTVDGGQYTWDYGSKINPHVIRLVDLTTPRTVRLCHPLSMDKHTQSCQEKDRPPGFLVALYYDSTLGQFIILNKPASDYPFSASFAVYTTTGTAQMVSENVRVVTSRSSPYSNVITTTNSTLLPNFYGNVDCETTRVNVNGAMDCVEKGDIIFILDPSSNKYSYARNPKYFNLYTVEKIGIKSRMSVTDPVKNRGFISLDMSINAAYSNEGNARIYKFTSPSEDDMYTYVSECSNRGICDQTNGICHCFTGYGGDACHTINNFVL